MAKRVILSVGTKRGLFLLESGQRRSSWKTHGPFLMGENSVLSHRAGKDLRIRASWGILPDPNH